MRVTPTVAITTIGGANTSYRVKTTHSNGGWATGAFDLHLIGTAGHYVGLPEQAFAGALLTTIQTALKSAVETKAASLGVTAGSTTLATAEGHYVLTFARPITLAGHSIASVYVEASIDMPSQTATITCSDTGASGIVESWQVSITGLIASLMAALTTFCATALGVLPANLTAANTA